MWRFRKSLFSQSMFSQNMGSQNTPERKPEHWSYGRKLLIWSERVLLISGLALAVFYGAARMESWLASRAAVHQFATGESSADRGSDRDAQKPAADDARESLDQLELPNVDLSLWGERRVKAYRQNLEKLSGTPLALLRIPRIGLEAPLFDGTDNLTLNHGVGRIAGTSRPGEAGNMGVAGHRDGFF